MLIGILALQGDFSLHSKVLNKLDVTSVLVRKVNYLVKNLLQIQEKKFVDLD